jgi:hypothetical protein
MIKVTDFTYISRLKRLEKIYNDGENLLDEYQKYWDCSIEESPVSCIKLNILAAQIKNISLILKTLKPEIKRLTFELSN